MAEYHRILSYLYRYDKKQKKDCKGFVKAEQKPSGLKLTIQIEDDRLMEDMTLAFYFYGKKGDSWIVRFMVRLNADRHHEEMTLFYPPEQLPEGFEIQKQYGVVLFYQESLYYASVWIGEVLPMEEILAELRKEISVEKDGDVNSESELGQEVDREQEIEDNQPMEPDLEIESENELGQEADREQGIEDNQLMEPDSKPDRTAEGDRNGETEEQYVSKVSDKVEKQEYEKAILIKEDKEKGDVHFSENKKGQEESQNKKESTEKEDKLMSMWINTEKRARQVDNIFNPAFRSGYKISVDQLNAFGDEAKRLADNQFLVKGYTRYRHLLAGKVFYAGEERYCVGVPGIYENREKYMAQIYRFPVFLSLTENRIKTGGFGYWLHLLQE